MGFTGKAKYGRSDHNSIVPQVFGAIDPTTGREKGFNLSGVDKDELVKQLEAALSSAKAEIEELKKTLVSAKDIIDEMAMLYGDDITKFRNLKQRMAITRRRVFMQKNEDLKFNSLFKKLQHSLDQQKEENGLLREALGGWNEAVVMGDMEELFPDELREASEALKPRKEKENE